MSKRNRLVLAVLWALSLVAVGQLARAQVRSDSTALEQAVVYSGSDIGFRVYKPLGQEPVGRVVVRMNGRWQEVDLQPPKSK
jgi:hypothetical protein